MSDTVTDEAEAAPERRPVSTLLIVAALFALWRVGCVWFPMAEDDAFRRLAADARDFAALGQQLAEHGEYRLPGADQPYSLRNPGFAIYLAGIMRYADDWMDTYFLFNCCAFMLLAIGVFRLGEKLRGARTGMLAAFLVAAYAPYHYLTFLVYREAICLPLFALFLLLILPGNYRRWSWLAMSALVGLMAMLREEFILLSLSASLAVCIGEGFRLREWRTTARRPVLRIAAMAAVVLLIMAPWVWRNWRVFNEFQLTGTLGGIQMYLGNNGDIDPASPDYDFYRTIPELATHTDHEINRI
jgi:hypothetical protein